MYLITLHLSYIEISVLLCGAAVLAFTVYFFITSRRSLHETLRANNLVIQPAGRPAWTAVKKLVPQRRKEPVAEMKNTFRATEDRHRPVMVNELKETISQQQKILEDLLQQVKNVENEGKEELRGENRELLEDIRRLEEIIEKKNGEINALRQQASLSQKLTERLEEIYHEFEMLQDKMNLLEKQAGRANNLAIELEDTRQSFEQVHKELERKQDRLDESFEENQRLQLALNAVEDKLAESNLQRQQLAKKVQFLQDLNSELQGMSDANHRLKTELRRIGELESMLSMISEERDHLLKRQTER